MVHIDSAILFGAVQGLSEFLPISSSGHLLLLHSVAHFSVGDDLAFDVALHMGTLLALIVFFWKDLWRILLAWLRSFKHLRALTLPDEKMGWLLIIASVPGAIFGDLFEKQIDTVLRSPALVGVTLIVVGIILWAVDRMARRDRSLDQITWWQSFWIGLGQAVALIPGVSRSGSTIIVGRAFGLTREAAARFSFLMAVPIIAGAGVKKFLDLQQVTLSSAVKTEFLIGMISAAIVGYLAIRVLLRFVSTHSYAVFAWYRLAIGVATLAWFLWIK